MSENQPMADGERQAVAHWLDRNYGPSVRASEWLGGGPNGGHDWLAAADDVLEVARKNRQGSQNPAQGGRTEAQGTPGGPEVAQGADGASVRSLGETIRAEAHRFPVELWGLVEGFARKADAARAAHQRDVQILGQANAKLARQVGAVEGLVHGWKRTQADNRAAMERGELVRKTPGPEDFLAVLDAINVHEACNRELSAALAMVDEARGDLAAQERITAELQPVAQAVHTVRTRGGVGEIAGVRIERVEDGKTASMRRAEKAEAAVERVRAMHQARSGEGPWNGYCTTCSGREWPCPTIAALDGGTEVDR